MPDLNGIIDPQSQVVDDSNLEGTTDPSETVSSEPEGAKEQEVTDPATDKKVQTPEENKAFREMRLKLEAIEAEKEQAKRDAMYARKYPDLGFSTEAELQALFGDEGIQSYEDLDAYYDGLRKAEEMEVSPKLLKVIEDLTGKVESLSKEKQDLLTKEEVELTKKEMLDTYGDVYTANEAEIESLAERMGMNNAMGIKVATATVVAEKFPQIYKELTAKLDKAKEEGVKEYFEKKKSEVPVEGSGTPPSTVGNSKQDPWKTARASAMEALKGTV